MLPARGRDSHKYSVMLNWKGWAVSPRICRQTCSRSLHSALEVSKRFLKGLHDYAIPDRDGCQQAEIT